MKCPACGKQARKGQIVLLLTEGKGLRGTKVCGACADGGVTVVAPKLAPVVDATKAERRTQKEVLEPFIRNLEAQLKGLRSSLEGQDGDDFDHAAYLEARIEQLDAVIDLLKSGRA